MRQPCPVFWSRKANKCTFEWAKQIDDIVVYNVMLYMPSCRHHLTMPNFVLFCVQRKTFYFHKSTQLQQCLLKIEKQNLSIFTFFSVLFIDNCQPSTSRVQQNNYHRVARLIQSEAGYIMGIGGSGLGAWHASDARTAHSYVFNVQAEVWHWCVGSGRLRLGK